jgi:RNA polymerase sigma-70 factor (ECF subfamily)
MDGERYRNGLTAGATPVPRALAEAADESQLARQYRERLRLFALRRLGDSAAAEDVAQETLRRVVDACRAGRLENPAALPGFVFQTAQHICLQHFRSAGREGRALARLSDEDPSPRESHPLATLISDERSAAVRKALEQLNPDDRELLRAVYYEETETAVLAERLGVTPGALRVRKHRVLARLAALLSGQEI